MAYTTQNARVALFRFLGISEAQATAIPDTNNRGYQLKLPSGETVVLFVYPLVHKQDNTKNYFDTRDSGAYERGVAWNFALARGMKYFCLGINDSVEKFKHHVFSLECSEAIIERLSGTKNGKRDGPGNQIIIPNDYAPSKMFDRFRNRLGTFICAIHKDQLYAYLEQCDNRPYMIDLDPVDLEGRTPETEIEEAEDVIIEAAPVKDYSIAELAALLEKMYNAAENKTTAIHMFGLKYGELIKRKGYAATAIVEATSINNTYHAEISKGVRIYESIARNEYGIRFFDENVDGQLEEAVVAAKKVLPKIPARVRTLHPLNCILYGAPGTGKTYATAQYALAIAESKTYKSVAAEDRTVVMGRYNALVEAGRIVFTTFHQNYGYEDFIQGIRPDTSSGTMAFKTEDGVFKRIADCAMQHPEQDYVIIIDEINRANISKVFGELITLIEGDKRWGEINAIDATLPSGEIFAVPNNLYILGTMNSADKSISLIDTALRRRFDFIEHEPRIDLVTDSDLRTVLTRLNEGISNELDSTDLLIGHSYFMNKTIGDLCDIMNHNIIPLLYEYFFDNQKKVEAQVKKAVDGFGIDVKSGTVGRIKVVKKGV